MNTGITEIPVGLFDYCVSLNNVENCFRGCDDLSVVPDDLFLYNTDIQFISNCFRGTAELKVIPEGIFDSLFKVTSFSGCFRNSGIESLPDGLFNFNTNALNFSSCFYNCYALELNKSIFFFGDADATDRFKDSSVNFNNCFLLEDSELFVGSIGEAPELWLVDFGTGTPVKVGVFSGQTDQSVSNYSDIPANWK